LKTTGLQAPVGSKEFFTIAAKMILSVKIYNARERVRYIRAFTPAQRQAPDGKPANTKVSVVVLYVSPV